MMPAEETNFVVLTPYDPREGLSLKQAAARAGKSTTTIKNWCLSRGIGRRVAGGVWVVSRVALEMLLDGDDAALFSYHSGDRSSATVKPYFDRVGVTCGPPAISTQNRQEPAKPTTLAISARLAG